MKISVTFWFEWEKTRKTLWNHIRLHLTSRKHLIKNYESFTTNLRLLMSYITLLAFKWTCFMPSIFNWPCYSNFSRYFVQKMIYFRFRKGFRVRQEKNKPKKTFAVWNNSFQRFCKTGFTYVSEKLIFLKSKNCLNGEQHCTVDVKVELTARWRNQKTKKDRNISLIGEKHLMLLIMKYQIECW